MSYGDDDWFPYEFNIRTDSPEATGNYNYEAGNIDNIPLNDDGPLTPEQGLDLDLAGPIDDYQYDPLRLSPNGGLNGQHQQPGTSGNNDLSGGQFQSMHVMQNTDTFDQHMQPSTSTEYNSFEMPTVINGTMDGGPYQDLGMDDPISYYANQQPSTSQGNDMIMNENYDMMGQQTTYMSQMDHVNSSSAGNPSSHSMMPQQIDNSMPVPQPPPKPKPKKKSQPKKKPVAAADTVGNVLNQMNKMNQQIENNNENRGVKVETRLSQEDAVAVGQLMIRMNMLREEQGNGIDRTEELANVEAELARLFSMNISQSTNDAAGNVIVNEINQIKNMNNGTASTSQVQQPKKAAPKKKNTQNSRNIQQQPQQPQPQQQQQMNLPPQAQMTPAKIVMEPPTTTMVPTSSQMNMYNDENYMYQPMDEQGTSQQQYSDFHQSDSQDSILHQQNQGHQQIIHAKVVPTMNQRTHNYRQTVILPSQNNNGPGPSPQIQQPLSHESHHMDQMHDKQYHPQDHQRPQSRQMYVPVHQQEGQMYQSQEMEPTLGDVVRQTQGRYQGPQDAPNLRQQLISNVNASTNKQILQRSQDPTPSPGNFHTNNIPQQQYAEPFQHHESYPSSHDMQPHSHSQQGYESQNQYDTAEEFYDMNQVPSQESQMSHMQTDSQHQQYDQQEMYMPIEEQDQIIESDEYYPEVPECTIEESKEKLEEKLEEKRTVRVERVKNLMLEQLSILEAPVDVSPFRGKMDILERMLPYHHFSLGEEPVSNFDATFRKTMTNAFYNVDIIGKKVRKIALRETLKKTTEWEENMLLFLDTESERRKLEEDRILAQQDLHSFLVNSEIIQDVRLNRLDPDLTRLQVKRIPRNLKELPPGDLSEFYKEYEFDSYDENRPRGSPLVYEEPESESESEPEPEKEEEEDTESHPTRSDISPLIGFPQPSPIPSPSRYRNESESTIDWKDEDESPLLSPETEKSNKAVDQLASEIFGTQEDLDKSEPFPFEQISAVARKQHELLRETRTAESVDSSVESSSTAESTPQPADHHEEKPQLPKPSTSASTVDDQKQRSINVPHQSPVPISASVTTTNRYRYSDEGSPELDEEYSMSPQPQVISEPVKKAAEEIPPIPLPVPIHLIKLEKEDSAQKLKLRVPINVFQKGIEMAASEDDDEIQEVPVTKREPLKLKLNLKSVKTEIESPDRSTSGRNSRASTVTPASVHSTSSTAKTKMELPSNKRNSKTPVKASAESSMNSSSKITSKADTSTPKTPIFKTPLSTPFKNVDSRKRRGEKIENSSEKNKRAKNFPSTSSFVTPKNGLISNEDTPIPRFLRTMTDGRRIVMKIGKIPNNINHFVTPRRDSKGNLHKDLSPTKDTRLKMRFYKKNGELAVEVTERLPDASREEEEEKKNISDLPIANGPCTSSSIVETPSIPTSISSAKGRPAPASRKPSTDVPGKDKKNNATKSKITFSNRFNPFASVPSSSKPTSSVTISSAPAPSPSIPMVSPKIAPSQSLKPPATVPLPPSIPLGVSSTAEIQQLISQVGTSMNLIKTTPIVPKITVTNVVPVPEKVPESKKQEMNNEISSLSPWLFNTGTNSEHKKKTVKPQPSSSLNSSNPAAADLLKVKTEPTDDDVAHTQQQESPRASSSLSMSFFEDDRGNGFPFLRSPKRTKEPLPVVEFSDDEEDDIAHSTFSHATDHLLGTSKVNKPANGVAPIFPWSTDP